MCENPFETEQITVNYVTKIFNVTPRTREILREHLFRLKNPIFHYLLHVRCLFDTRRGFSFASFQLNLVGEDFKLKRGPSESIAVGEGLGRPKCLQLRKWSKKFARLNKLLYDNIGLGTRISFGRFCHGISGPVKPVTPRRSLSLGQ